MKLLSFWTKDTCSWFTLAESTFNRSGIADPQLHFDLVLPALPEEVIQQLRGIVHAVNDITDPYRALKIRLLDLFTPKPLDQCQKIINGGDLGDMRPSQLMEDMLALLPPGEPEGMLFKTHFINRLLVTILDHVVTASFTLTSTEMAAVADNLWFARNSRQSDSKHHPLVAAVQEDVEEIEEAVAALNVQPKRPQPKKKAAKGGKSQGKLCYSRQKYGDQTWKCADPRTCTWSGNK